MKRTTDMEARPLREANEPENLYEQLNDMIEYQMKMTT